MNEPDDYRQHARHPASPEYRSPMDDMEAMTRTQLLELREKYVSVAEDEEVARRFRLWAEEAIREINQMLAAGEFEEEEEEEDNDVAA